METRMHLKMIGRVQGVGYRNWACQKALALKLKGWVKNCADGSVEAEVQGSEKEVTDFLQACHQGPALARVDQIKKNPLPTLKLEGGEKFEIRYESN